MGAGAGGERRREGGPAACPQRRRVGARLHPTRGPAPRACSALPHAGPALAPSPAPPAPSMGKGTALPCGQHCPASQGARRGLSPHCRGGCRPARAPSTAAATAWPPAPSCGPGLRPSAPPGVPPRGGQPCARLRIGPPMGLMHIRSWKMSQTDEAGGTRGGTHFPP